MWDFLDKLLDKSPVITLTVIGLGMFIIGSMSNNPKFRLNRTPRKLLQISGSIVFLIGLNFLLLEVGVTIKNPFNEFIKVFFDIPYYYYLLLVLSAFIFLKLISLFRFRIIKKVIESKDGIYINVTNTGPNKLNCVAMLIDFFMITEDGNLKITPPATLFQWANNPTKVNLNQLEQNDFWVIKINYEEVVLHLNRYQTLLLEQNKSYLILLKIFQARWLGKEKMAEVRGIVKIQADYNPYSRKSKITASFLDLPFYKYLVMKYRIGLGRACKDQAET